ncbi:Acyl-CoA:lysophosphatidylglycerol acyltransferase 1 [Aphanomyces cochlioides]|nr:Acyl-CoA:lysophosphatidylglycerol acyltransferase 1 [Aphanomyces cochlioides]
MASSLRATLVLPLTVTWLLTNMVVFFSFECVIYLAFRFYSMDLYRSYMGMVQTAWIDVIACVFPKTDIVVTGQLPTDTTKPAIIVCNHQVDADWWFLWEFMRRQGGGGNVKICLKDELKYVPVFGWGLYLMEFLYVKRNLDHDSRHVAQHMARFEDFPFWMLLFPEGTTINTESMVKSHRFAKTTNRPHLERLLLPRTAGFETMLGATQGVKPDIYDLTLSYPSYSGEVPTTAMGYSRLRDLGVPSMSSLIWGTPVDKIYLHGKKVSYDEVAGKEQAYLDGMWREKEALLDEFIAQGAFASKQEQDWHVLRPQTSKLGIFKLWVSAIVGLVSSPLLLVVWFPSTFLWSIMTTQKSKTA